MSNHDVASGAWPGAARGARSRAGQHRSRQRRKSGIGHALHRLEKTCRRADGALIALAIVIGALLAVSWQSGGYFPAGYLRTGAIAAFAAALLLLFRPPTQRVSREAMIALAALGALTVWTWLARTWSAAPASGLADAQRDLGYLAILVLAVIAAGSGRIAGLGVVAVLAAMLTVVLYALAGRLFPTAPSTPSDYRLSGPLDYWNAFGAMAAMTAILAAGFAADRRLRSPLRALASSAAMLSGVALYLSLSRGAWLALGCGLIVLVVMAPRWSQLIVTVAIIGAGAGAAILRLHSLPALVDNPNLGRGQAAAGHQFAPWLGGLAVACFVLQFVLSKLERRVFAHVSLPRPRPLVLALIVGVVLVGGLVGFGSKLDHALSRAWNSSGQSGQTLSGTARLNSLQTSRHDAYQVGIREWRSAPLFGTGSGSYQVGWYRYRNVNETIVNAHSLYIETMAELGLVGLAMVLTFVGALLAAGIRARIRPVALSRTRTAAVTASVAVWVVHAGIDWDWQMTALTGLALVLAATLLPPRKPAGSTPNHPVWRLPTRTACCFGACACACVIAGVYMWSSGIQAQKLDNANRLGANGDFAQSLALARTVSGQPASAGAKLTEAYDLQDLGDLRAADTAFRNAAVADPANWYLRMEWATVLLNQHELAGARREITRAEQLNHFLKSQLQPPLSRLS